MGLSDLTIFVVHYGIIAGTTLGAAGAGLIFSTYVLDTFSRERLLIPLDVTIDHALVAAALFGGLRGLTRSGTARELGALRVGLASTLLGVTFSWINAVILNTLGFCHTWHK